LKLSSFNQAVNSHTSFEGEAVRLSNELRAKPAHTSINHDGIRVDYPAVKGFDCETADFKTMVDYLADTRIKKSASSIAFVHRIMSVRFPNEYTKNKSNIDNRYKLEMEMIESKSKNDVNWFGETGFQNMVRLDGTLTNNNVKVKKLKNNKIEIVRK
tara:strand:+ start:945 stop:1415 length:471 start_codon:yes stop_codon:yes gene_type:complete